MLTGRRAFEDEDVSMTLSKVLQREPDFDALPPAVPARVSQALRVCLRKDPKQRVGDIRDVRVCETRRVLSIFRRRARDRLRRRQTRAEGQRRIIALGTARSLARGWGGTAGFGAAILTPRHARPWFGAPHDTPPNGQVPAASAGPAMAPDGPTRVRGRKDHFFSLYRSRLISSRHPHRRL